MKMNEIETVGDLIKILRNLDEKMKVRGSYDGMVEKLKFQLAEMSEDEDGELWTENCRGREVVVRL